MAVYIYFGGKIMTMKKFSFLLFGINFMVCLAVMGCNNGTTDPNVYTVTFDTDDGSSAPSPINVEEGKTVGTLPSAPTKTANIFKGWFTEQNGGGTEFKADTVVNNDIKVYAKWETNIFYGQWKQIEDDSHTWLLTFDDTAYTMKMNGEDRGGGTYSYSNTKLSVTPNGGTEANYDYSLINGVLTFTTGDWGVFINKIKTPGVHAGRFVAEFNGV
jgi:uncharacterized repeat protein (TIGR02543 family)